MLQRNLLYTGVTRGKRIVILLGQKKAVVIAVAHPVRILCVQPGIDVLQRSLEALSH